MGPTRAAGLGRIDPDQPRGPGDREQPGDQHYADDQRPAIGPPAAGQPEVFRPRLRVGLAVDPDQPEGPGILGPAGGPGRPRREVGRLREVCRLRGRSAAAGPGCPEGPPRPAGRGHTRRDLVGRVLSAGTHPIRALWPRRHCGLGRTLVSGGHLGLDGTVALVRDAAGLASATPNWAGMTGREPGCAGITGVSGHRAQPRPVPASAGPASPGLPVGAAPVAAGAAAEVVAAEAAGGRAGRPRRPRGTRPPRVRQRVQNRNFPLSGDPHLVQNLIGVSRAWNSCRWRSP